MCVCVCVCVCVCSNMKKTKNSEDDFIYGWIVADSPWPMQNLTHVVLYISSGSGRNESETGPHSIKKAKTESLNKCCFIKKVVSMKLRKMTVRGVLIVATKVAGEIP